MTVIKFERANLMPMDEMMPILKEMGQCGDEKAFRAAAEPLDKNAQAAGYGNLLDYLEACATADGWEVKRQKAKNKCRGEILVKRRSELIIKAPD